MPSIIWEGPQLSLGSLAHVNRELCSRILDIPGFELSVVTHEQENLPLDWFPSYESVRRVYNKNLDEAGVHVRHQWPPDFLFPQDGMRVLFQPWEYGNIPKGWVGNILYNLDEVWVYSQFTKNMYLNSGIPSEVIFSFPLGVDVTRYSPTGQLYKLSTNKSFKFLFVGGTIWRKGIDILLNAFRKQFSIKDDVCLVIKDFGTNLFYKGQTSQEYIKQITEDPNAPEIIYIPDNLSPEEMAALYRTCDVLVQPYRGEGFGLPILEAMACGLPVIIPDKGPATEFTNANCALYIPSIVKQSANADLTNDLATWIEVDSEVLARTLELVTRHKNGIRDMGLNGVSLVRERFTWDHSLKKIVTHLNEMTPRVPNHLHLREWVVQANMHRFKGEWVAAEFCFKKVLAVSTDLRTKVSYAETLYFNGKLGEVITYLAQWRDECQEPILKQQIMYILARSMADLLRYPEAINYCEDALEIGFSENINKLLVEIMGKFELEKQKVNNFNTTDAYVRDDDISPELEMQLNHRKISGVFRGDEQVLYVSRRSMDVSMLEQELGCHVEFRTLFSKSPTRAPLSEEDLIVGAHDLLGHYDGIIISYVFETLPIEVISKLVIKFKERLKRDGRLVVIFGRDESSIQSHSIYAGRNARLRSKEIIQEILVNSGLSIKEIGTCLDDTKSNYLVSSYPTTSVLWESPMLNGSGYATGSQMLLKGIRAFPYKIRLNLREAGSKPELYEQFQVDLIKSLVEQDMSAPAIHFQNVPAYGFVRPVAPISVGRTMFETDRIPEDWVWRCNELSDIWVPSKFNVETFSRSGVDRKRLHVIHEPFDFNYYKPFKSNRAEIVPGLKGFVFLSVFAWVFRKGWDVLLRAYVEEFSKNEDVTLLIKTSRLSPGDVPEQEINEYLRYLGYPRANCPRIVVVDSDLMENEMRLLYSASDAFVLPTRGEGWGRPFVEAMSMELPVIGTNWGGNTEFLNAENSYLIDIDGLEPVDARMSINFYHGHHWATPSVASTRRQMRHVRVNYQDAKARALSARVDLLQTLTPHVVAQEVDRRLRELMGSYA